MAENLLSKFLPAEEILEATFMLVLVYLVLSKAFEFSSVVRAMSSAYVGSVKALQGR